MGSRPIRPALNRSAGRLLPVSRAPFLPAGDLPCETPVSLTLPTIFTVLAALAFFTLERLAPGRELPNSRGWYGRAILINLTQIGITLGTNTLWLKLFSGASLFQLAALKLPVLEGFIGWFVGTFFFYWWHRIRHVKGFWEIFHQVHHSPARIEAITSFYKHPVEILANSALAAAILYFLLGCSLEGALWFNFFAATGEYLLSRQFQVAALAEILHPDARAALGASRARRASLQLRRHSAVGPAVRHLP